MYCGVPKGTCQAKATLDSKKNQAHSLSSCQVTLYQSSIQSVENSIKFLMEVL